MGECTCGQHPSEPLLSQEALKLLEKHHQFPGQYMFKVIGWAGPWLAQAVQAAAESVLGPLEAEQCLRTRPSSGGRYLSVTLEAPVASANQVLEIYAALRKVEGVVVLV